MTSEAPETYTLTLERESGFYEARRVEYIRADLHQQALEAARAEGRRAGLEEAANWVGSTAITETWEWPEAIRALSPPPADPVAEAAGASLSEFFAKGGKTMEQVERALAQKEGE